MKSRKLRP